MLRRGALRGGTRLFEATTKGDLLARRKTPQTFEKRRRERDKKQKKEEKQLNRIWRNAEKRDAKLRETDPEAWARKVEADRKRARDEGWEYE